MSSLSKVTLKVTAHGVPRGVIVDGNEIKNVCHLEVEQNPGEVTRLKLTINVSEVETVVGGDAIKNTPNAFHGV